MIEGLKIQLSSQELYELLDGLVVKHGGKAKVYEEGVSRLEAAEEFADRQVSGDPIGGMRQKSSDHQNKATMFAFMRDHVIEGEMYILKDQDLYTLEIMSRY